jgi:hypothetical protein
MYHTTNSLTESPQIKSYFLLSYLCSKSSWMKTLGHFKGGNPGCDKSGSSMWSICIMYMSVCINKNICRKLNKKYIIKVLKLENSYDHACFSQLVPFLPSENCICISCYMHYMFHESQLMKALSRKV